MGQTQFSKTNACTVLQLSEQRNHDDAMGLGEPSRRSIADVNCQFECYEALSARYNPAKAAAPPHFKSPLTQDCGTDETTREWYIGGSRVPP
jgi:hypothetical protein